jgi:hypothetical protein|tara:strand:- start:468 stop:866 length:399 start_codon:yes stop_codon:yes gene_type:complete
MPAIRRNKYNAQGNYLDYDGKKTFFHSKAEGERFKQLIVMRDDKKIMNLVLQPSFVCVVNNVKVTTYRADFSYDTIIDNGATGNRIVEDVKGQVTDIYKIKKKLVESLYFIKIIEIPSRDVVKWENKIPESR